MNNPSFRPDAQKPAWPMPARYAELLASSLRSPFTRHPASARTSVAEALGLWLARLRLWLCPCGSSCSRHA